MILFGTKKRPTGQLIYKNSEAKNISIVLKNILKIK